MSDVSVQHVTKVFPGHGPKDEPVLALEDVSFEIQDQEFCSILGHSGCGKTTLLTMLAGFEQPTEGRVLVDGKSVGKPSWTRAVVFQDYALFPWLTVERNVAFGLEMKKVPAAEREVIVERSLRLVGLAGFEHRYPHQLSGGMKQRVSIARALAVDPQVLLMDEPFAALDAQTRDRLGVELQQIWSKTGQTIVFITHNLREAACLGDRVLVMSHRPGRLIREIAIDLPRPRRIEDEGLIESVRPIMADLREEVAAAERAK